MRFWGLWSGLPASPVLDFLICHLMKICCYDTPTMDTPAPQIMPSLPRWVKICQLKTNSFFCSQVFCHRAKSSNSSEASFLFHLLNSHKCTFTSCTQYKIPCRMGCVLISLAPQGDTDLLRQKLFKCHPDALSPALSWLCISASVLAHGLVTPVIALFRMDTLLTQSPVQFCSGGMKTQPSYDWVSLLCFWVSVFFLSYILLQRVLW